MNKILGAAATLVVVGMITTLVIKAKKIKSKKNEPEIEEGEAKEVAEEKPEEKIEEIVEESEQNSDKGPNEQCGPDCTGCGAEEN